MADKLSKEEYYKCSKCGGLLEMNCDYPTSDMRPVLCVYTCQKCENNEDKHTYSDYIKFGL